MMSERRMADWFVVVGLIGLVGGVKVMADDPSPGVSGGVAAQARIAPQDHPTSTAARNPQDRLDPHRAALFLSRAEGHHEVQDNPPAPASVLSLRATSPGMVVTVGQFTSVQVNVNAMGNNVVGDAANEPSIAIDPTNPSFMAIGWRQFDTIASNFRQAGNAFSTDGGQTWTFPGVLDPGQFRSDPVLASDANGVFYYSSLQAVDAADVFRSFDGGATWGVPVPAFGGDKQWIAVDRTAGIGSGTFYQFWNVQFSCCPPNDFTRSIDQGQTFEGPFPIAPTSMKWGTMDVAPDGRLYLVGATLSQSGHLVGRSSNAGDPNATPTFDFVNPVNLGGVTSFFAGPNPEGLAGQVWVATDHSSGPTSGNIYILAAVDPPGSDPQDIMFIRSEDDGLTWSAPVRVNDDDPNNGAWQWFGTISVAPNGRIDVVWNDTRNSGVDNLSETFRTFSRDGGRTWAKSVPITPVFDSHIGWPQQNKMGDYYDMISDTDGANLAFSATFNGEQDVYFMRIPADCNNNGINDDLDIINNTSNDCDGNGIPDECQLDCNQNGVPDGCDIVNGTSEDCNQNNIPDECESGTFDCTKITIIEDGPPCLEVQVTLPGANQSGTVTLNRPAMPGVISVPYANGQLPPTIDIAAEPDGAHELCISSESSPSTQPDSITFEALNTSCGPGGVFDFFLNGVLLATVDADPADGCTCTPGVQQVVVSNPALLANWIVGGPNTVRARMTGGAENLAWIRVRVVQGAVDDTFCLFDTGSNCISTDVCSHNFVSSPVDATQPFQFTTFEACRGFTKQGETLMTINSICPSQGVFACERGTWDGYTGLYADIWADVRGFVYLPNWGADGNPGSVHIVDISDPTMPQLASQFLVPPPNADASPQDVKEANGLLFIGLESDFNDSVAIVDVRDPFGPSLLATVRIAGMQGVHNVFIDNGFLYIVDSSHPTIAIVDLTTFDPNNPPPSPITTAKWVLNNVGALFVHDITVRNGRLYAAAWDSLQIFDVTNVATQMPTFLGSAPGSSVHSCWPTDDGQFVVTGEERPGGGITVFRITNNGGSVTLTQTDSLAFPAQDAFSVHNQTIIGNRLYNSWYEKGLQVFDIDSVTGLLSFVAEFDTSLAGTGNWGVYPFLGEDRILLSDTDTGLSVVSLLPVGQSCPCPPSSVPQAEMILSQSTLVPNTKVRVLSFTAGDPGRQQAIRLTFDNLPPPFDVLNAQSMWVVGPRTICEDAGQVTGCLGPRQGGAAGPTALTFTAASLGCDPDFQNWSAFGTIHVFHQAIVPEGTYRIEVIDRACQLMTANFSPPLILNTSLWGDLVEDCTQFPCGPPDGRVDVTTDVTAIIDKFKNLETAPAKVRADLEPALLDMKINISDATFALDAFMSQSYPFTTVPPACP